MTCKVNRQLQPHYQLDLELNQYPISSTNNQKLEASSHSRNSSSSLLTSIFSSEEQDVTIAPPVAEGHVKRLAYPLSFFKYHGPSQKPGNSLYICTVKGCKKG
uniref:Uncharacterized protein n=1 Tax=Daphnia galeata TaxID=27404 RepID=A0A8J2WK39_9CRUS|nr:unnamed protein product [Daphnia galeata]